MLALTGTPVNVLVSNAADDAGVPALRVLRVRPRRRPAAGRHDRASWSCSVTGCCPTRDARPHARPTSASHARDPAPASTASSADVDEPRVRVASRGVAEVVIPPRSAVHRRARVFPGMVDRERRPRRPGRPAARARTSAPDEPTLGGRRRPPAAGPVGGHRRRTLDDPERARRRPRPSSCAARPSRSGCAPAEALVVLVGMVVLLATGVGAAGRRRAARGGRDHRPARRDHRAAPTGPSPWTTVVLVGGDDPAVDRDVRDGRRGDRRPARSSTSSAASGRTGAARRAVRRWSSPAARRYRRSRAASGPDRGSPSPSCPSRSNLIVPSPIAASAKYWLQAATPVTAPPVANRRRRRIRGCDGGAADRLERPRRVVQRPGRRATPAGGDEQRDDRESGDARSWLRDGPFRVSAAA